MSQRGEGVRHGAIACTLLALMLLATQQPQARTIDLGPDTASLDPSTAVELLPDPGRDLSIRDLLDPEQKHEWQLSEQRSLNLGITPHPWWLRLEVRNPGPETLEQLLEVAYPPLNELDVYLVQEGEIRRHYRMGNRLPFAERPIPHRFYLAPLSLAAGDTATVYMRVHTEGALRIPLRLWEPGSFLSHDPDRQFVASLYFGALLIMMVYHLLLYTVVRERVYLYFIGYITSLGLLVASLSGHGFRYLWPEAVHWNQWSVGVLNTTSTLLGVLFAIEFLRLRDTNDSPLIRMLLRIIWGLVLAMALAVAFLEYTAMLLTTLAGITISSLMAIYMGFHVWWRGERMAPYYLAGWGVLLLGGVIMIGARLAWLPQNPFTENAIQLGSALLLATISLGLADRINEERRLRLEAQHESLRQEHRVRRAKEQLLEEQQRVNRELEQRVEERTRRLEEANRRLRESSITDPLTGLRNRRFFDERLQVEYNRCFRNGHRLALIFIDVDRFKDFNDRYGHPQGDACLEAVARAIERGAARQADVAARYGGEEFCVLLPETDMEGARAVAERIRAETAALEFRVEGEPVALSVSIGVASTTPAAPDDSRSLVHAADQALYQAKAQGRDRVVCAPP